MKSEPEQFGIADLERVKIEPWTGVRSYFARAHMRAMSIDDAALFHHSGVNPPGVAGLARIVRTGVVDETQFDPASKYYDPKATREQPIWDCVEVEYVATLPHFVAMDRIRGEPGLADMLLLRRGMRLSVQPVTEAEYEAIVALGQIAPPPEAPKPPRAAKPKPARAATAPPAKRAAETAAKRTLARGTPAKGAPVARRPPKAAGRGPKGVAGAAAGKAKPTKRPSPSKRR